MHAQKEEGLADSTHGETIRLADLPSEEQVRVRRFQGSACVRVGRRRRETGERKSACGVCLYTRVFLAQARRDAKEGEVCLCRRGNEAVVWMFSDGSWNFQGVALNPVEKNPELDFEGDSVRADQLIRSGRAFLCLCVADRGVAYAACVCSIFQRESTTSCCACKLAMTRRFFLSSEVGSSLCWVPLTGLRFSESLCDRRLRACFCSRQDNPLVAAETFVARENLPRSAVSQISSFISENVISQPRRAAASASTASAAAPQPYRQQHKHFPVLEPLTFSKATTSAIVDALLERKAQVRLGREGLFEEFVPWVYVHLLTICRELRVGLSRSWVSRNWRPCTCKKCWQSSTLRTFKGPL